MSQHRTIRLVFREDDYQAVMTIAQGEVIFRT